jgi:hypothetical protein
LRNLRRKKIKNGRRKKISSVLRRVITSIRRIMKEICNSKDGLGFDQKNKKMGSPPKILAWMCIY